MGMRGRGMDTGSTVGECGAAATAGVKRRQPRRWYCALWRPAIMHAVYLCTLPCFVPYVNHLLRPQPLLYIAVHCRASHDGDAVHITCVRAQLFLSGSEYRPDGEYQLRLYDPAGLMAAAAAAAAAVTPGSPAAAAAGAAAGAQGVSGGAGAQLVTFDDW